MENRPPQRPQQVKLEIGEKEAEGIYANLALITHSPSEIVFDFARFLPGAPKARVQARIVMAPRNVKRLMAALADNLKKYEERYGEIPDDSESPSFKDIGFTSR